MVWSLKSIAVAVVALAGVGSAILAAISEQRHNHPRRRLPAAEPTLPRRDGRQPLAPRDRPQTEL